MARAANTEIAPETKNSPSRTLTSIVMRERAHRRNQRVGSGLAPKTYLDQCFHCSRTCPEA